MHRRSTSRSRVIKSLGTRGSTQVLDPYKLLHGILDNFKSTDIPVTVTLSDGTASVNYSLNAFLKKDYNVENDLVSFGLIKLNVNKLTAQLSYSIDIADEGYNTDSSLNSLSSTD